eukprot:scaffold11332_cov94-Isochrysis_galbana.AAC.6
MNGNQDQSRIKNQARGDVSGSDSRAELKLLSRSPSSRRVLAVRRHCRRAGRTPHARRHPPTPLNKQGDTRSPAARPKADTGLPAARRNPFTACLSIWPSLPSPRALPARLPAVLRLLTHPPPPQPPCGFRPPPTCTLPSAPWCARAAS